MRTISLYRREHGAAGVRNRIAVISTVACANHVVEQIAAQVPLALDPAAQRDRLARVAQTQVTAVVGAAEVLQIVHKINSIL